MSNNTGYSLREKEGFNEGQQVEYKLKNNIKRLAMIDEIYDNYIYF